MYLLDTNIVSELRRRVPHGAVVAWIKSTPADSLFLPAIVAGEIQMGIERTRKNDAEKAAQLSSWLQLLLSTSQWITPGPEVFLIWGQLVEKAPNLLVDALVAATAIHHNMTVVTRNVRDFHHFNVPVLNPFDMS
jgi:predicted nucleic acid-binding protein